MFIDYLRIMTLSTFIKINCYEDRTFMYHKCETKTYQSLLLGKVYC